MSNLLGKILIVSIFIVGALAAVLSIAYLRSLRSEAVAFWGAPVALNLRDAERVELLRLEPIGDAESDLDLAAGETIAEGAYRITAQSEITGSQGLLQLRLSLLDNGTFRFDAPVPEDIAWNYALRFTAAEASGERPQVTTLLLEPTSTYLWHLESGRKVDVQPQQKFLSHFITGVADKLPEPEPAADAANHRPQSDTSNAEPTP